MKEIYSLNYNYEDGFVEFFQWPNKYAKNCNIV